MDAQTATTATGQVAPGRAALPAGIVAAHHARRAWVQTTSPRASRAATQSERTLGRPWRGSNPWGQQGGQEQSMSHAAAMQACGRTMCCAHHAAVPAAIDSAATPPQQQITPGWWTAQQHLTCGPLVSYTSNTPEPPVSDTRRKGTCKHSDWIGKEYSINALNALNQMANTGRAAGEHLRPQRWIGMECLGTPKASCC